MDAPQLEVVQHTLRVRDERSARAAEGVSARPATATAARSDDSQAIPTTQKIAGTEVAERETAQRAEAKAQAVAAGGTAVSMASTRSQVAAAIAAETEPHAPAAKVPAALAIDDESVKQHVLALVSEKTGYPIDMLDVDLDLEADLGVDTVKQAEVFATIREAYGIPRDEKIKLRDFPTLAHVIRFVHERRGNSAAPATTQVAASPASERTEAAAEVVVTTASPAPPAERGSVKDRILALVVEKTGYPKDMLDPDLDLEADLGVDTVKQAEMFAAIREIYGILRDPNLKLRDFPTLTHVI